LSNFQVFHQSNQQEAKIEPERKSIGMNNYL
jgi:hypothetical protein